MFVLYALKGLVEEEGEVYHLGFRIKVHVSRFFETQAENEENTLITL